MYSFDSIVRYSEVDCNCKLSLVGILNYFQDCSCFQSESLHAGVTYRDNIDFAWLLNSWQVVIHRYPTFAEEITIGTWAYNFDPVYGYRNFVLKDKAGNVLACANSHWVYVDSKSNKLIKITKDNTDAYPIEPKYEDMEYAPRKIKLPKQSIDLAPFPVVQANIDSNHHVNNAQYIQMATSFLENNFKIKQMRAEYKKQAVLGDLIYPSICITETCYTIILANAEKQPYCVIEFTGDKNTD